MHGYRSKPFLPEEAYTRARALQELTVRLRASLGPSGLQIFHYEKFSLYARASGIAWAFEAASAYILAMTQCRAMRVWLVAALVLTGAAGTPCHAWDDLGHMTAAAVAYAELTPAARASTARLLALNPDYASWIEQSAPEQQQEVAFLRAALWPDAIKHMPGYRNDGERPRGATAARNIGYADHLQHRYWHFIDQPLVTAGSYAPPPTQPNVLTQIALFRATLRSPSASDALKSYDLVWLLHLVADVHQPLHAVSRFSSSQPRGDAGGNRVRLCEPPCRAELHGFWDQALGKSRRPESALRLAARLPPAPAALAAQSDPALWARESFELARTAVYVDPVGEGAGPYELTPAYKARARRIARERIALAGARLAQLLNDSFSAPQAPSPAVGAAARR